MSGAADGVMLVVAVDGVELVVGLVVVFMFLGVHSGCRACMLHSMAY